MRIPDFIYDVVHLFASTLLPSSKKESRLLVLFILLFTCLVAFLFFVSTSWARSMISVGMLWSGSHILVRGAIVGPKEFNKELMRRFHFVIALIFPILLSVYFLEDAKALTIEATAQQVLTPWTLFTFVFIVVISGGIARHVNEAHPSTSFLNASAVIFLLCLAGHSGLSIEKKLYDDAPHYVKDENAALKARDTGAYAGQFLLYVTGSYAAMLIGMRGVPRLTEHSNGADSA